MEVSKFNMFGLFRSDKAHKKELFYTIIYDRSNIKYAICDAVNLINNINVDIALLNRAADENHINKLLNEFESKQHFMGSIKLVYQTQPVMKYRIIDGQHRYLALVEYMKRNPDEELDIQLLLELYEVDDVNGDDAREYFRMANTVKNIDYENDIKGNNSSYEDLVIRLEKSFPNTIKDVSRVQYPNICSKELKEQLKRYNLLEKYTLDELYKKIIQMNTDMIGKDMTYFFGNDYRESKEYDKMLNGYIRAKNNKCFLGIKRVGKSLSFILEL